MLVASAGVSGGLSDAVNDGTTLGTAAKITTTLTTAHNATWDNLLGQRRPRQWSKLPAILCLASGDSYVAT